MTKAFQNFANLFEWPFKKQFLTTKSAFWMAFAVQIDIKTAFWMVFVIKG